MWGWSGEGNNQMQVAKKKKYSLEEYISCARGNPIVKAYNWESGSRTLNCLCGRSDGGGGVKCLRCGLCFHFCMANKANRGKQYECLSCLNKNLDPLFQVSKVLVECIFRTENIFEYQNHINMQFVLKSEDIGQPIEVRGLRPGNTGLSWPMQGCFFVNDQAVPFHDLKPLLVNSNRKTRREEYFTVPLDKLRVGVNYIRFRIYNLDRNKFTSKFQYEDRQVYYFSVNKIKKLSPQELISETFQSRRMEPGQSIALLQSGEIEVVGQKVCLTCPYTRERIKVPVRGKHCIHFSCVCLETLIATHLTLRYWSCPICEERINEPVVDIWIFSMLKDNQAGSDVVVNPDGSYHWLEQAPEAMSLDSDEEEAAEAREAQLVVEMEKQRERQMQEKERMERERVEKERAEREKAERERLNRQREALSREKLAISAEKNKLEVEERKRNLEMEMRKQDERVKERERVQKERQKKEKELKEKERERERQKEKEREKQRQKEKERIKANKQAQKPKFEGAHQTGRKTVAPPAPSPPSLPQPITIDIESDSQAPPPAQPSNTPSDPRIRRANPVLTKMWQKLNEVSKNLSLKSKPQDEDRSRAKREQSLSENKRMVVISDVKTLQMKEMSKQELHKHYFKNRKREARKSDMAYFQDHRALASLFNFSFT